MKQSFKRLSAGLLALFMLLSLSACQLLPEYVEDGILELLEDEDYSLDEKESSDSELIILPDEEDETPPADEETEISGEDENLPETDEPAQPDVSGEDAKQDEEAADEPDVPVEDEPETEPELEDEPEEKTELPVEGEYYYDLENVVLYVYTYGKLPPNYITKKQAQKKGWQGGAVDSYMKGNVAAIGGDYFGNREGLLPKAKGRSYTECDIDTLGNHGRGAKRLVFSNDGLFFYTDDHYESFTEVYVTDKGTVEWK